MSGSQVPYNEIDANIRFLVEIVNRFPDLHTIDSCGSHVDPAPYQEAEGAWRVGFVVDHTEEGWRSLEFLAWAVSDIRESGSKIALEAFSHPPYLNTPGACLSFVIHAKGLSPDKFATTVNTWRDEDYVAVEDDEAFLGFADGDVDEEEEN